MASADVATSGTPRVPDVAVFTIAGHPVSAGDVVASLSHGRLDDLRRTASRGLAARDRAEIDESSRRAAEQGFRQQRRLVAAEEMEAWLATWHLDVPTWRGQVRRGAALARDLAEGRNPSDDRPVDHDVLWAALVVEGVLERGARELAERMAAAAALGHDPREADPDDVARWRAGAVTDAQVDRELSERALDWTRVAWEQLHADTLDAAREARLCLTDDGTPSGDVGRLLGHPVEHGEDWLHRTPPDLREPLLGTPVGQTSPPLPHDHGHRLVHLLLRSRPAEDDQEVRAAVRAHLADQALDLEVRDRVVWHVTF